MVEVGPVDPDSPLFDSCLGLGEMMRVGEEFGDLGVGVGLG